jgi:MFS family permease
VAVSLWRHRDFLKLWSAVTVSTFGSLLTLPALPFMAILVLNASPGQIAGLRAAEILPGFLVGLVAGVWVDRLRRRPLMIAADVGRAVALGSIPVVAWFGRVGIEQLYLVAFTTSILTEFFEVAYQSHLPAVVNEARLVEANSKVAASQSAAEVGAFGVAGWLVQLFTAPVAIAIDAVSFLLSAGFIQSMRTRERGSLPISDRPGLLSEMIEGVRALAADRTLRAIAGSVAAVEFSVGLVGTVYLLYCIRELGFSPGPAGVDLCRRRGELAAGGDARPADHGPRWDRPNHDRRTFVGRGRDTVLAAGQRRGFAGAHVAGGAASGRGRGRHRLPGRPVEPAAAGRPAPDAGTDQPGTRFTGLGATLLGTLAGGVLGQTVGYRPALVLGAVATFAGALILLASPIARRR